VAIKAETIGMSLTDFSFVQHSSEVARTPAPSSHAWTSATGQLNELRDRFFAIPSVDDLNISEQRSPCVA